jgi:hypothetical protein
MNQNIKQIALAFAGSVSVAVFSAIACQSNHKPANTSGPQGPTTIDKISTCTQTWYYADQSSSTPVNVLCVSRNDGSSGGCVANGSYTNVFYQTGQAAAPSSGSCADVTLQGQSEFQSYGQSEKYINDANNCNG